MTSTTPTSYLVTGSTSDGKHRAEAAIEATSLNEAMELAEERGLVAHAEAAELIQPADALSPADAMKIRRAFSAMPYGGGLMYRDAVTIDDVVATLADFADKLRRVGEEQTRRDYELQRFRAQRSAFGSLLRDALVDAGVVTDTDQEEAR